MGFKFHEVMKGTYTPKTNPRKNGMDLRYALAPPCFSTIILIMEDTRIVNQKSSIENAMAYPAG